MSRSRRQPIFIVGSKKYGKKYANKKVRRSFNMNNIKEDDEIETLNNGLFKRMYEQYDICDWVIRAPENEKAYRK